MTAKKFCELMHHYWNRYGWKTTPITAKEYLWRKNKKPLDYDVIPYSLMPKAIDCRICESPDWMDQITKLAYEFEGAITGIAVLLSVSEIYALDIDSDDYDQRWRDIGLPTSKTKDGYHMFFKSSVELKKNLVFDWGSFAGCGKIILPPSEHYYMHRGEDGVVFLKSNRQYQWISEPKGEIPVIDPFEENILPAWSRAYCQNCLSWTVLSFRSIVPPFV